jgi:hypothetical protein
MCGRSVRVLQPVRYSHPMAVGALLRDNLSCIHMPPHLGMMWGLLCVFFYKKSQKRKNDIKYFTAIKSEKQ